MRLEASKQRFGGFKTEVWRLQTIKKRGNYLELTKEMFIFAAVYNRYEYSTKNNLLTKNYFYEEIIYFTNAHAMLHWSVVGRRCQGNLDDGSDRRL